MAQSNASAATADDSSPQSSEHEAKPVIKKHHKFPVLLAILGVLGIGAAVYFLIIKPGKSKSGLSLSGRLTETFSGNPLADMTISIQGGGKTTTDANGHYSISLGKPGTYTVRFNMTKSDKRSLENIIPSIVRSYNFSSNKTLNLDLPEQAKLFPPGYDPVEIIASYRGRDMQGYNGKWVQQPKKFIVQNINHHMERYPNSWNNLLNALNSVEEYTHGIIKAPSRDQRIVQNVSSQQPVDKDYAFTYIGDNDMLGAYQEMNSNKEIIWSYARAPASNVNRGLDSEVRSAFKGGDCESKIYLYSFFNGYPITQIDLNWGLFDYGKRKTLDRFLPAPDAASPYDFPVEIRKID